MPQTSQPIVAKTKDKVEEIIFMVSQNIRRQNYELTSMLALELFPIAKMSKSIVNATRTLEDGGLNYNRTGN